MLSNLLPQLVIIMALLGIIYVFARKQKLVYNREKQILEFIKKFDYQEYFNIIKKFIKKAKPRKKPSSVDLMIQEQKYIQIITQDPKNIFAYTKLGNLYLKQKNKDDAKAAFKQVLKLDPDNQEAENKLKSLE